MRERKVIIIDIDGTIADEAALTEAWTQGVDTFKSVQCDLVRNAAPMHDVLDIIDALVRVYWAEVHVLTARSLAVESETREWLKENCPFEITKVHMAECASVSAVDYKESVILSYAPEEVICIFENNDACCEMFASHGFRTFKVMEVI